MKSGRIFIDRFSSIDHLTRAELADDDLVLQALKPTPRVSTFEMSENKAVRMAINRLVTKGAIRLDNKRLGYPWHAIVFPDAEKRFVDKVTGAA